VRVLFLGDGEKGGGGENVAAAVLCCAACWWPKPSAGGSREGGPPIIETNFSQYKGKKRRFRRSPKFVWKKAVVPLNGSGVLERRQKDQGKGKGKKGSLPTILLISRWGPYRRGRKERTPLERGARRDLFPPLETRRRVGKNESMILLRGKGGVLKRPTFILSCGKKKKEKTPSPRGGKKALHTGRPSTISVQRREKEIPTSPKKKKSRGRQSSRLLFCP